MMRYAHLLLGALVLALASPVAAEPLLVHVGGRAVPLPGGGYEFGWPGVYFEARFFGPEVEASVDAPTDNLVLTIDGKPRAELKQAGHPMRMAFRNLGAGEHTIRLQKTGETQASSSRFLGFFTGKDTRPLAPPRRARQIEFIGDSYSVGYGNTSTSRTCTQAQIRDTTDTRQAFGPRLAERLGADYRVNAYSGYGVVRNYNGAQPGDSMLNRYPRVIPANPLPLDEGAGDWRPQLIVIELGTNDFSTPLHAGEAWADKAALQADYRAHYIAFVRGLMQRQPQARFILMAGADYADQVEAVAKALDAVSRVRVLTFSGLELTGCDWHPSVQDDALLADRLYAAIAGFGEIWSQAR